MYVNSLLRKRGLKLYKKKYFEFYRFLPSFFIVRIFKIIEYSKTANQLSTEQYKFFNMVIYTYRFSRVLSRSNPRQ